MLALLINAALFAGESPRTPASDITVHPTEVVVTGERISRSLKNTSSSVDVFTADAIAQSASDRVDQLLEMVPNLQMGSGGEGPTIRGQDTTGPTRDLPAFLGGTRPRTTLVVDGRAVSYNEFVFGIAPVWDLDRLEVFRSPQTTTQGQNSIAGAIFLHTKDPTFTSEFGVRTIAGDYRTRQLSAFASGKLTDDVAIRLAGDLRSSRPASRMADKAVGANPNHDRFGLLRFKLLATPAVISGSRLELTLVHSESQAPQVEGVRQPFHERRDPVATYGTFQTKTDSLTGDFRVEPASGLAVDTLVTGGTSRIRRFAPQGLGETRIRSRDWSAESVADWFASDSLRVVGGISYRTANLEQYIDLSQLSGKGQFADRQSGLGLFGEATWSFSEDFRLAMGLRYQRDAQTRTGALGTRSRSIDLDYRHSFHAWLPKTTISYDFSPSLRVGALVQRGYNPGGTTLRFDTGEADNFAAESLWDCEVFARAGLFGGAVKANANLFYYAMRNAQRAQPITILAPTGSVVGFADIFNLPRARSYGVEAGLDWRVTQRLSARLELGLLDTRITKAGDANRAFEGKEFQRSPHLSATAAIDWRPLDPLRLSAQLRRNGGYFSDDLNDPRRQVGRWTKVDARAEWSRRGATLFAYARNIFDAFYLTYLFGPPTLATAGDPREIGIGLETRF